MAVYAISDLHLSIGIDKPMDIFGGNWIDYMKRIAENWNSTVTPADSVIIPGDISWATYLEQAKPDFEFIDSLPGRKYIFKGNHDYWWTTLSKLNAFKESNKFDTIFFLNNSSVFFESERLAVCGSRGWKCPVADDFSEEDMKIYLRELQRLELSVKSAKSCAEKASGYDLVACLHFPPFDLSGGSGSSGGSGGNFMNSGFVDIINRNNVKICIYGHIHGEALKNAFSGTIGETLYIPVSADLLSFMPLLISGPA